MSKQVEYLLVGSVPDLVEAFIRSSKVTPMQQLDDTTYLVLGEEKGLCERLTKVANLYTKEDVQRKDSIPGVYSDKVALAVASWAGKPSL